MYIYIYIYISVMSTIRFDSIRVANLLWRACCIRFVSMLSESIYGLVRVD